MTTTISSTEAQVLDVLAAVRSAHAERDAAAIVAPYVDDAVRYTLAPPLQQTPDTEYGDESGLEKWLATFDGPIVIEHRNPEVIASDDGSVAYVSTLTRMSATPAGSPEGFSFWYRSTYGLRRVDGAWRIAHQHESTPFHMDGSFLAATDLEP